MSKQAQGPAEGADVVMTPAEVATWLHLKPRQLERFGVPAIRLSHKITRYLRADVLAWLAQQRKAG